MGLSAAYIVLLGMTRIKRMQALWNCPLCTSGFLMMVGAISGFKLEFMRARC